METDLRAISPRLFLDRRIREETILDWFQWADAVWLHNGKPESPHAELTSGKCSNGFFDCLRVLKYPNICEILAWQLVQRLKGVLPVKPDWVIGSAYAAITFSHEAAKVLGACHGFVEKDPTDPSDKRMIWPRLTIPEGANVLQVEELITTSGTFQEVRRAVLEGNKEPVNFIPVVGTLVHRPPVLPATYSGIMIVSLIEKAIWAVGPKDCHLCKAGSPRYRPKTHWAQLTGKA